MAEDYEEELEQLRVNDARNIKYEEEYKKRKEAPNEPVESVEVVEKPNDDKSWKDENNLSAEELSLLKDGVEMFRDFLEYGQELTKRGKQYVPLDTAMYLCRAHPLMAKNYPHVVEILAHEGCFSVRFFYNYLILMRENSKKEKAVKDAMYDMMYILDKDKDIPRRKQREIFHRFVNDYREQDQRKKEVVDEATERAKQVKEKNKEIYKEYILERINSLKQKVKDGAH